MKKHVATYAITRRNALVRLSVVGGTATVAGALAACGTQASPPPITTGPLKGAFTFSVQNFQPTVNVVEKAIASFQRKNPDVKITYTPVAYGDMASKTSAEIAAGSGPDGFHTYTGFWRGTDAANIMLPLTPTLFRKNELDQLFFPNVLSALYSKKNEYFVLPFSVGVNGSMLLWNTSILSAANVDPKSFTTLDSIVEGAKKLVVRAGSTITRAGLLAASQTNLVMRWIIDQGGKFYDEKTYTWTWQTPEAQRAVQWLLDLYDKHGVAWRQAPPEVKDALGEQRTAMKIDGAYSLSGYTVSSPDVKLADTPMPAFVSGKTPNYYEHEYSAYALSSLLKPGDPKAKLGAAFFRELLSPDSLLQRANEYSGAILVKGIYSDPRFKDTTFGAVRAKLPDQVISKIVVMTMAAKPDAFQAQLDKVMAGQMSISAALAEMQQQYTAKEDEARRNMR